MASGIGVLGSIVCQYAVTSAGFDTIVASALAESFCRPSPAAMACYHHRKYNHQTNNILARNRSSKDYGILTVTRRNEAMRREKDDMALILLARARAAF
jgi:hypothetical protein